MSSGGLPQKRRLESPTSPAQSSADPFQEVVETMQSKGRLLIFVPGNCDHIHGVSFMTQSTWSSEQLECPGAGKSKGSGKAKDVGKNPEESLRSIAAMQANQPTKGTQKGKLGKGEVPTAFKGMAKGKESSEDPSVKGKKGMSKGEDPSVEGKKGMSKGEDPSVKGNKGMSKGEDPSVFKGKKGIDKGKDPGCKGKTICKGKEATDVGTETGASLETLPMLPATPPAAS